MAWAALRVELESLVEGVHAAVASTSEASSARHDASGAGAPDARAQAALVEAELLDRRAAVFYSSVVPGAVEGSMPGKRRLAELCK